ncbi:MAG: hypothetical protein CSA81_00230 [Acidobacteria bacterium]|nr:MAG: hypothetical protein CSA81_00230 [Acidobacteriota bacterium]
MSQPQEIYISLISHTNVGKTSMTRTLLRKDVGEVRDEPHVTTKNEAYLFLESADARLFLWDTPGFGDIRKVLERVKREGGATAWLRHHLVDRLTQRALFCSVEALKHIRADADLVIYLVNGAENPEFAGYPHLEMELLSYFKKDVLIVVNQVSHDLDSDTKSENRLYRDKWVQNWKTFMQRFPFVVDVIPLDAHHPIPKMERKLLESFSSYVKEEKRAACRSLVRETLEQQRYEQQHCTEAAWRVLTFACHQAQPPSEDEKGDFEKMQRDLSQQMSVFTQTLMKTCRMSMADQAVLKTELADLENRQNLISEKKAGLWSGLLTGAISGLTADIMSGGLSFGGGALLGGLSGWLAAYYGSKGVNQLFKQGKKDLKWSNAFLVELTMSLSALYLRVLHHGRARGVIYFSEQKETEYWFSKLLARKDEISELIDSMVYSTDCEESRRRFESLFRDLPNIF